MDNPYSPKLPRDQVEGMAKEGAIWGNKENLMCPDHKTSSQKYRENYDKINWGLHDKRRKDD